MKARHWNYKHGMFAGSYTTYRYGDRSATKSGVDSKRIFTGEKRKSVVNRAIDVLRDWRFSPFENEGAVVSGLRSALCMQGHNWQRANTEATLIVSECFRVLGVERPSWDEGQPGHAIAKEDCNWCGQPIDQTLMGRERRYSFCSEECAKAAIAHRNLSQAKRESRIFVDAWDVIQRSRNPATACGYCGNLFRPVIAAHNRYCVSG